MAKFENVGYIAKSKKDEKKFNLCMEKDGVKHYFILKGKPSPEEVENNPRLGKVVENWPDWKKFDVIKITDED